MSDDARPHHGIDYVELPVAELAAAQRFYAAAFGWTFNDYGPAYAGIVGPEGREVGGLSATGDRPAGRDAGPLVILHSHALDATREAVEAAGGRITTEPFTFPGGRRFHFEDPSGNELAVWAES